MIFSSTIFLFLFLPLVLLANAIAPIKLRNLVLTIASLIFYAWGELEQISVMLISVAINFAFGIFIERYKKNAKTILAFGVALNLVILIYYKYFNFFLENINAILDLSGPEALDINNISLPIGISFFTFHGISYIVDVYRTKAKALRDPIDMALYIALFPQLIAGPIIRYSTVMEQLQKRVVSLDLMYTGIQRFIIGLAKKIIIANSAAQIADHIFNSEYGELGMAASWLGIVCYALQIYFDFSGYSDMAIGLARMVGFEFQENFNFPYVAKSIQDFWRRWHISLSSWFRDYVYIPLGGSRMGSTRTYVNLFIVFLLTGFWHGASWSFIVWGLFHGIFLIIEKTGFSKILKKLFLPLQHIYTLLIVLIGWVFFRVEEIGDAILYLKNMFGFAAGNFEWSAVLNNYTVFTLLCGIVFSMNLQPVLLWLENKMGQLAINKIYLSLKFSVLIMVLAALFLFCSTEVANNTYNPFIYYRF